MQLNKIFRISALLLVLLAGVLGQSKVLFPETSFSPKIPQAYAVTSTFSTSGSWEAPAGVTSVLVEVWAGGGGAKNPGNNAGVGGGGGGAFSSSTVSVTPGNSYAYVVGVGGNSNGEAGGDSYWVDSSTVFAQGGEGATTSTAGAGGLASAGAGTVKYSGGNGAAAVSTNGGGGGGGAGSSGNGGNATGVTAGTGASQGGGAGGTGTTGTGSGTNGSNYGGGAGGSRRSGGTGNSGQTGGSGLVRITYNAPPAFTVVPADTPDPVSLGEEVTFSATATDEESDQWKLIVCTTDSVTPGSTPSCASPENTYCVSSSAVASGAQNTCTWTSTGAGAQDWFAFACDTATTAPSCSSASTTNSPITIASLVSISITSDGEIAYGVLSSGSSLSTVELSDTQTVQNDGAQTVDINIKTSVPSGWALGLSPSEDTFVQEFSINGGSFWQAFTTADTYQTLFTGVTPAESKDFDLRFTAPNPSNSSGEKSFELTLQAVSQE